MSEPLNPNLSPTGKDRRLAQFVPEKIGKPDFLFASAASKHSVRLIQTLQPLSEKIDVQIDSALQTRTTKRWLTPSSTILAMTTS
jgi:hypothetical protein